MKAIKGLEDRLYALDQMIASCKKLVNEQKELAQVRKYTDSVNCFVLLGDPYDVKHPNPYQCNSGLLGLVRLKGACM